MSLKLQELRDAQAGIELNYITNNDVLEGKDFDDNELQHLKINKRNTIKFDHKFPSWFSMDIQLNEIILSKELFLIKSWLSVFFKDSINHEFEGLFKDYPNILDTLKKTGSYVATALPVEIRKRLPLKSAFLLNASKFNVERAYFQIYDITDDNRIIWKLYYCFTASCSTNFELNQFPFDYQLLNIQIVYDITDFHFLSECPDWITNNPKYELYGVNEPIKLMVKDSIKTSWQIKQPWFDFQLKREEYNFHFSVIQLRVKRKPLFYLLNGVLPLFLVVSCSFASYIMPVDEFLGDKLTYIITLLLTTAAFQYSLLSDLPKTSESTKIDTYVLVAYFILSILTLEIAVSTLLYRYDYDIIAYWFEIGTLGGCALIWLIKSLMFLILYCKSRTGFVNWEKASRKQKKLWSAEMKGGHKYIAVDYTHFAGTDRHDDLNFQ